MRAFAVLLCVAFGVVLGAGLERSGVLPGFSSAEPWGAGGSQGASAQVTSTPVGNVNFNLFWEVWNTLKDQYYQQPVEDKALFYGALEGMAAGTKDPYTTFFEPQVAEEFAQGIQGAFGGIGAEIGLKDSVLQVIAPLDGTPASRAGVKAGDVIVKIDGEDTEGLTVEEAVRKIRGEQGTRVTLSLFRAGAKTPVFDVTITRDIIHIESVSSKMLSNNIAYLQVKSFNADTADKLEEAIVTLKKSSPKGWVLDLRNDPGGLLDQAQRIAGMWVGDRTVLKERKQGVITEELEGQGPALLQGAPTVILVNGGSASASEIVAGALQDYKAATLIGTKTFGKGSVQELHTFRDGSALKVTIAEWLTPLERAINKAGLEPDIKIDLPSDSDYDATNDPVIERAIQFLLSPATASSTKASTSGR